MCNYVPCKIGIIMHRLHLDIDECGEKKNLCNQTCSNSVGSYNCSCESGYRLAKDGISCNGKTYHLIYETNNSKIRLLIHVKNYMLSKIIKKFSW